MEDLLAAGKPLVIGPVARLFGGMDENELRKKGFSDFETPMQQVLAGELKQRRLWSPLSEKEQKALLATAAGEDLLSLRDRALLSLLLSTGIRTGELLKLHIRDIDFLTDFIQICPGEEGARSVPFSGETEEALRAYIGAGRDIFLSRSDLPQHRDIRHRNQPVNQKCSKGGNKDNTPANQGYLSVSVCDCLTGTHAALTILTYPGRSDRSIPETYFSSFLLPSRVCIFYQLSTAN